MALENQRRLDEVEFVGNLGSWEWNPESHHFVSSTGLYRLLGWASDFPASFGNFLAAMEEDDRSLFQQALEQATSTRQPFCCDCRITHPLGETRWLRINGHPLVSEETGPLRIFGTSQDITERVHSEMCLAEATIAAESASRTKAEFLANMSHEIRTPMNGIIGMCHLLLESVSDSKQREQLRIIQDCGNSLICLINDILDFSKLEAGKVRLETIAINLHQITSDLVQLMTPKAVEKKITLSYQAAKEIPDWIIGDPVRFRQILTNLVSNAVKFTDRGSVVISSKMKSQKENQVEIEFAIRDSGIGISEHDQKKLFLTFSQVDLSTTRKYGGTGLGLAICKGLVEQMGGRIWVESLPGQGAIFSFTLVAEVTDVSMIPQTTMDRNVLNPRLSERKPLRILIAEDNPVNQLVIVGLLEKQGYKPTVVGDGVEAVARAKKEIFDLIFMDFHMPRMDGLEATKKILEFFSKGTRPHIVALTASAMREDVDRCLAAGMSDFISKPIQIKDLNRILDAAIALDDSSGPPSDEKSQLNTDGSAQKSDASVLDWEVFSENYQGLEDILVNLIDSFATTEPKVMNEIKEAISQNNANALQLAAHSLKGAVSNFFAHSATLLAWELEEMGKSGKLELAPNTYAKLEAELVRLLQTLVSLKQNRTARPAVA